MSNDNATSSAIFHYKVANLSNLITNDEPLLSEPFMIRGLRWRISVQKQKTFLKPASLRVFLKCDCQSEEPSWSCFVQAKLSLLSTNFFIDDINRTIAHKFNSSEGEWGFTCFASWVNVTDPLQGYIDENDAITIRAHVIADHPIIDEQFPKQGLETEYEVVDESENIVDDVPQTETVGTESSSSTITENDKDKLKSLEAELPSLVGHDLVHENKSSQPIIFENDEETRESMEAELPLVKHDLVDKNESSSAIKVSNDTTPDKVEKIKESDKNTQKPSEVELSPMVLLTDEIRKGLKLGAGITIGDLTLSLVEQDLANENESSSSAIKVGEENLPDKEAKVESPSPTIKESDKDEQKSLGAELSLVKHDLATEIETSSSTIKVSNNTLPDKVEKVETPSHAVKENDKDERKSLEEEVAQLKQYLANEKSKSEKICEELKVKTRELEDNRLIIALLQSKITDFIVVNESEKNVPELLVKLDSLTDIISKLETKVATLEVEVAKKPKVH